MYIDKDGLTRSLSAPEIVSAAQVSDSSDQASAGNSPGFAPISRIVYSGLNGEQFSACFLLN